MITRNPHAHTPIDDVYTAAISAFLAHLDHDPGDAAAVMSRVASGENPVHTAVRAGVDAALAATLYCAGCLQILCAPWGGLMIEWGSMHAGGDFYSHLARTVGQVEAMVAERGMPERIVTMHGSGVGLYAATLINGEPRCSVCMSH
jgi:hypothetical protein